MTKQNYTDIHVILDRSGSMGVIARDTIGGFNAFVEEQKKLDVGTCTLSLHQFDDIYQTDYLLKNIQHVEPLTENTFVPRGWTALNDAIGKTITEMGERYRNMKDSERPDKVIVLIMTDGGENSSVEYKNGEKLREMIKTQTDKYSWEFVYIGANQDAIATATHYGIHAGNALNMAYTNAGVKNAYASFSHNVSMCRTMGASASMAFSNEDASAQADAGLTN